jgi:hypothetical protein
MPYKIVKDGGGKPFKIINKSTGEQVGASKTKADAEASVSARLAGEHGWKPTKRR